MTESEKNEIHEAPMPPVVVIGRQFGCGGRKAGRTIADAFSMGYYDKTLLAKAAGSLGFDRSIFDSADERRPSWIRSLLSFSYGVSSESCDFPSLYNEGLYNAQSRVIKSLPAQGPCVIVGRTADYVLRDYPGLLSIFLYAPLDFRVRNIMERHDADDYDTAVSLARKMDRCREDYYSYYTNRRWGRAENYHLCIDTSRFSTVEILAIVRMHLEKSAM